MNEEIKNWIDKIREFPVSTIEVDNYPFGTKTYHVYTKAYIDMMLEKLEKIIMLDII